MTGILDWLSRITLTCFTASYALALALELARLCFRLPAKHLWRLVAAPEIGTSTSIPATLTVRSCFIVWRVPSRA